VDGRPANTVRVAFASGTPSCNYAIAPTNQSFAASGGTGSVNVTAPAGCAWTAAANAAWLAITAGSPGNGPGTVNYFVAANTVTSPRTGTLTIAGQPFTITQAGAASSVTVLGRRMTGGPIPDACGPPAIKTAFLATDERAYQWTLISGGIVGDQVRWEFAPTIGSFLQTAQYTVTSNGSQCFWASLSIAATPVASMPGNWQARVFYNNVQLFTESFTIGNAAQVIDQKISGGPIPNQSVSPSAAKFIKRQSASGR